MKEDQKSERGSGRERLCPAEQYAQRIRANEITACELVHLAVDRYYRDLNEALDKGWYFDRKAARRAISFIERLKHTKGE